MIIIKRCKPCWTAVWDPCEFSGGNSFDLQRLDAAKEAAQSCSRNRAELLCISADRRAQLCTTHLPSQSAQFNSVCWFWRSESKRQWEGLLWHTTAKEKKEATSFQTTCNLKHSWKCSLMLLQSSQHLHSNQDTLTEFEPVAPTSQGTPLISGPWVTLEGIFFIHLPDARTWAQQEGKELQSLGSYWVDSSWGRKKKIKGNFFFFNYLSGYTWYLSLFEHI